jgi:hypothetical protein
MLANGATHIETLPMRVMDFVTCNFTCLGECVDKIVREANRHERRVRLQVQQVANGMSSPTMRLSDRKKVEQTAANIPSLELSAANPALAAPAPAPPSPTPFEKMLANTYKSEDLLELAAEKWKVSGQKPSAAEAPPPPPPGAQHSPKKRKDGKSESCAIA